jgi:hypothetical protein
LFSANHKIKLLSPVATLTKPKGGEEENVVEKKSSNNSSQL